MNQTFQKIVGGVLAVTALMGLSGLRQQDRGHQGRWQDL